MAATSRQCAITLLPNNVEMCFWCPHIGFSHPGNQFRAVITSIINISKSYEKKTNVASAKRHIVVQCNNNDLFNKVFISHLIAEKNKRNIRHVVKMCNNVLKCALATGGTLLPKPCTRVKQNTKLIHQGSLHNHGNNDTYTCSIPIETRSRLNLTIYDSSN